MQIPIYVEKLYKYDLKGEPCSLAVPFAQGELKEKELASFAVTDSDRNPLLCDLRPTATWPDGSVKYLFVRFAADIPANRNLTFYLTDEMTGTAKTAIAQAKSAEESTLSCVRERSGAITVRTGKLQFRVQKNSPSLFEEVVMGEQKYCADQFTGPVLTIEGRETLPLIENWEIVEQGKVCCILEGTCHYETRRLTIRLTTYAGKDSVEVSARLFNDADTSLVPDSWNFYINREAGKRLDATLDESGEKAFDSTGCGDMNGSDASDATLHFATTGTGELEEIERKIRQASETDEMGDDMVRTFTGISNYKTRFTVSGKGETLTESVHAKDLIQEANEHFGEVFYGTFMADYCDAKGGVCATIFQAQQNFPKAIKAGAEGLCLCLIPEGEEKVHFSAGMAREQKFLLQFHDAETPMEELDNRSMIYQMPIEPFVAPEQFQRAGVFLDIVTPQEASVDDIEVALIANADGHGRAYGMMNWGDFPDFNYTAQGRGGGRLVWSNNEYDYPHAMFMMYARTGVRRFLDYAKVASYHWMDVDICHYSQDQLRIGGQWEHTACHNGGDLAETSVKGVMVCSHEWVEGLLDLWHFTGDSRAYETALGIGENILRLLETPMYQTAGEANARETGWALRSLTALYVETHDEKWMAKAKWIVDQFALWQEKYGAWLAPYTDNTVIRVGFMISVAVGSLMRYYREFPEERVKTMLLSAIDDLVENGQNGHGIFYYKELPSLQRNGNNTLLLESMYIGYELTGDKSYLEVGRKTFLDNVAKASGYNAGKKIAEDAVLVGNTSPKGFAQSFLPMTLFYNACIKENLL